MNASKSSVVESTLTWPMQNQAVLWTQPDFTGYLEKCVDNYWQNFFFVLQGSFLFYFTNDIGENTTLPLEVIPVEGCKLQISRRETEENLEKFAFVLGISSQYAILAKHGTYILAALSQEAMDEWIEKLSKAANSRTQLFGELRKIRAKVGKFRILLPKLPLFHKLLASVQGVEAKKLQAELAEVRKQIMALQIQAKQVRAECDQEEMKISKALVTWDVVFQYASGEVKGETCNPIERLKYQAKILKDLYELMQSKGNILQGEGLEKLSQDARTQLHDILQRAVDIIQERHAKICSKAPNYSREIDPKIYELDMTIHQPNAVEQASQNKEQDLPIQDPQGALQYINEVENLTVKHGTIDTEQKFNIAGESQLNKEVIVSASTSKSSYDNAQPLPASPVSQSTSSMLAHQGTDANTEPNRNRQKVSWNDSVTEINNPSGHMFDQSGNPEIVPGPLGTHEMSMKDQALLASIAPPHDRSQATCELNQATAGLGVTLESMQSKSDEALCILRSPQQSKGHSEPEKIETTILSESTALDSHFQGIFESILAAIPKVPTHKSGAIQQTATQRNDIERSPVEQSERSLLEQFNITHISQPTAPSGTKTVSTEGLHPTLLETNFNAFRVKFQTTEESTKIDANQDLQSEHQHEQLLHRKHASAQQHVLSTQHSAFSTTAEGNVHLPRLRSSLSRGGNDPFLDEIQAITDPSRPSHNQDSTSHSMQEGSKISDRNLPLQNLEIGSQSRDFGQIGTAIDGARHAPPHPLNESHQSHDADNDVTHKTTGNVNPLPDHDTPNMAGRRSSMKGQTLHLSPTAITDNPRTINLGKSSRYLSKESLDSTSPRQDISTAGTSDAKFNRKEYKAKLSDLVNRKGPIVVYQDFNCVPVNQPSPTKPGD